MQIEPDENGTCTLCVLKSFDDRDYDNLKDFTDDLKEQIGVFNEEFEAWRGPFDGEGWLNSENHHDGNNPFHTLQMTIATTSHKQENAERYLAQFGFRKFGPKKAIKYGSDSLLTLWFLENKKIVKKLVGAS